MTLASIYWMPSRSAMRKAGLPNAATGPMLPMRITTISASHTSAVLPGEDLPATSP